MSTVVIAAATRDKLLAAGAEIEFRDEAGNLIGRFARTDGTPVQSRERAIEGDWPSSEEIERRLGESKRYTSAEVEQRLRDLRKKESE